jgi:hypothetical protein
VKIFDDHFGTNYPSPTYELMHRFIDVLEFLHTYPRIWFIKLKFIYGYEISNSTNVHLYNCTILLYWNVMN